MIKKITLLFVVLWFNLSGCSSYDPIKIGFTASLTGRNAALGVDGRDGVILAVETVNANGGVAGRPLHLLIEDDYGTPEGALAADRALLNANVTAVIGHMTSDAAIAAWPAAKDSGIVFLSPTVSTPLLAGIEDNFFRLITINAYPATALANYAAQELGLRKVVIFYDTDNLAFTGTYRDGFITPFENNGGMILATHEFASSQSSDFTPALEEAQANGADGIFVIASAVDTALIAQQARILNYDAQILASTWSFTEDLIQNGGNAVENIITVVSHNDNNDTPAYLAFDSAFETRFGRRPTFAAGYGYEAVLVLAAALERTEGSATGLADALLKTEDFPGVYGTISFDPYGDVKRTLYLLTVENGEMKTLKSMNASDH
jgi:branched-chain amino acid transport system substrate-binding protein